MDITMKHKNTTINKSWKEVKPIPLTHKYMTTHLSALQLQSGWVKLLLKAQIPTRNEIIRIQSKHKNY